MTWTSDIGTLANSLIATSLDAVIVMNEAGRIVEFNPIAERIFGYPKERAIGARVAELIVPPALRARHEAGYRRYIENGDGVIIGKRIELEALRADGEVIPVEMTVTEVRLPTGRVFASYLRDLSDQRRAIAEAAAQRERLQGLEKLSALGTLLSGVAHELNNPLSIILAQSTLLVEKARDDDTRRRAERIHGASERCSRILKSFMAMARQKPRPRLPLDCAAIIRDALELTAYGRRSAGIVTEPSLPLDGAQITCDRDIISQALSHLLVFAQARVMARAEERRIDVTAFTRDEFVVIEIADNGPNVPDHLVSRLFTPFAPTDPTGAGTGIGLHLAHDAAVSHDGRLTHEHRAGGGAVFRLILPRERRGTAARTEQPRLGQDHSRVLIVDDELEVGRGLAELLRELGYVPEVIDNPRDALGRLRDTAFDLVVADFRMPGMDGRRFLRQVINDHPAMRGRCVLATGDVLGAEHGDEPDSGPIILAKPFSLGDVRSALAQVAVDGGG
jgi:PAS domain S-box-containing protein